MKAPTISTLGLCVALVAVFMLAIFSVGTVLAVAPVITVPGLQTIDQDTTLTFSTGNGNLISVTHPTTGALEVTLGVTNGLFSLVDFTPPSPLSFAMGDGINDATMTFTGTVSDINTALDGMVFTPTPGFVGEASLDITSNDLNHGDPGVGSSASDTVIITVVDTTPPVVTADLVPVPGEVEDDEGDFIAQFSCSDPDDPDPQLTGVMVIPSLAGLEIRLEVDDEVKVKFDLVKGRVKIKALDPDALLAELQQFDGVVIDSGQLLDLDIDDDDDQEVEFKFKRDGRLKIKATSAAFFVLRATCENAAGLVSEVDATPTFAPPLTPAEAIDGLIDFINALPPGDEVFKDSLITDLLLVKDTLGDGQAAVDLLEDFVILVEAEEGKKLTNDQAEILIDAAEEIIDAIEDD